MRTRPTDRVPAGPDPPGSDGRGPRTTAGLVISTAVAVVVVGAALAPPVGTTLLAGGAGVVAAAHVAGRIEGFPTVPSEGRNLRLEATPPVAGIVVLASTVGSAFAVAVLGTIRGLFTRAIDVVRSPREVYETT